MRRGVDDFAGNASRLAIRFKRMSGEIVIDLRLPTVVQYIGC